MEEDAGNTFCDEDIDQILERRTTVVKHDNQKQQGSIFSKASFTSTQDSSIGFNLDNLDVNDPNFWQNWATKANIQQVELDETEELIVNEPRNRKKVTRFGEKTLDSDEEGSEGSLMLIARRSRRIKKRGICSLKELVFGRKGK
jgi:hypothetical protein